MNNEVVMKSENVFYKNDHFGKEFPFITKYSTDERKTRLRRKIGVA